MIDKDVYSARVRSKKCALKELTHNDKYRFKNKNKLKILHLNIQYAREKIDLLNVLLELEGPDIVVLCEHGLRKEELYCINFNGYNVVSDYSRSNQKSSGGVVVLAKDVLGVNVINVSKYVKESVFEVAGTEVILSRENKLILFGVYRPPCYLNINEFFRSFYSMLTKYLSNDKLCIILGDLNIDWLKDDSCMGRLKDLMNEFDLNQFVHSPTRVTSTSSTLIDHVLSNISPEHLRVEVVGTGLSDHFAQTAEFSIQNFPTHKSVKSNINMSKVLYDTCTNNLNILNFHLSSESWECLYNTNCPKEKFNKFFDTFIFYFTQACPIKNKNKYKRANKNLWLSKGIQVSSLRLKDLDLLKKTNKSDAFHEYYKNYKKIYRKVIRAAKAKHMFDQLNKSDNISKDAWRVINKDRKKKPVLLPTDTPSPDEFNNYFANVGKQKQLQATEPFIRPLNDMYCFNTLFLHPSDPSEIYNIILNLKNSNAAGYDGITHKVIRHCANHLSYPLSMVINSSLASGVFPDKLKQTIIRPAFKDGNSRLPESWRPIANVSTFSKIYEHVFSQRLLNFLFKNDLLCKEQFGFIIGKNTVDAMAKFVSDIILALDQKYKTVGVFLDLQKAFDCINHKVLLDRLSSLGIRGPSLNWIRSFLENRSQIVEMNSLQSGKAQLNFGIPQGSVLGPILFILYTNSITKTFPNLTLTMYADDIALLLKKETMPDLETDSFIKLSKLYQYLNSNNLHVNPEKTTGLVFSSRGHNSNEPMILMNDFELPLSSETKYLGLIFDDNLTWSQHINALCLKLSSQLFLLNKFAKYNNLFLTKLIYSSLIESRLTYGILLWGSASATELKRVFRLQKRAIRIMTGVNRRTSCRQLFISLNLLTLASHYIYQTIIFYKFKYSVFKIGADIHSYNTRHKYNHRQTSHRLDLAASLPQNIGPKLYNKLPGYIKENNSSSNSFKNKLKKFLMEGAFYSVGEFMDL
jgi:hypothetical protein